ncbi:MAG: hypothetical protein RI886_1330, partial [Pseudomonadota bacterium]
MDTCKKGEKMEKIAITTGRILLGLYF